MVPTSEGCCKKYTNLHKAFGTWKAAITSSMTSIAISEGISLRWLRWLTETGALGKVPSKPAALTT